MTDGPPAYTPDYRMTLAAERTFLAYIRTGLALTAAAVALAASLPTSGAASLRRAFGVGLIALGAIVVGFAKARLVAVTRAMRLGEPLPETSFATSLVAALLAIAAVAAVIAVLA